MYILKLSCKDRMGIVAAISTFIFKHGGDLIDSSQFSDSKTKNFFMRVSFVFPTKKSDNFEKELAILAEEFDCEWELCEADKKPRLMLMVSKASHCLNHLLHNYATKSLHAEIALIVSNHEDLENLASWHQIPFCHLPINKETKLQQEEKLYQMFVDLNIDLLVLARYMQILSPYITDKIFGHCINIHHSFLPSFKGKAPYQQAYDKGVKIIGATAHYVSQELDEGPIIEQEILHVDHSFDYKALVSAGKDIENIVLMRAIKKHIEKRVFINGNKTVVLN